MKAPLKLEWWTAPVDGPHIFDRGGEYRLHVFEHESGINELTTTLGLQLYRIRYSTGDEVYFADHPSGRGHTVDHVVASDGRVWK